MCKAQQYWNSIVLIPLCAIFKPEIPYRLYNQNGRQEIIIIRRIYTVSELRSIIIFY